MVCNQKRYTFDVDEVLLPDSSKQMSSAEDNTDSGMVGGFSPQSRTTKRSTRLQFTPPPLLPPPPPPAFTTN